jgi:two-component system, NarL family, nitrate/nitrite response regulator NarL
VSNSGDHFHPPDGLNSVGPNREEEKMGVPVRKPLDHPTQVFLTIENRLVREALVRLFRKRSDVCVVGHSSPTEATDVLDSPCEIVVLDDLNAASVLGARLLNEEPATNTPGLVLIGMEEEEEKFLTAVRSGVSGYLLNDASASDVVSAVRAVASGNAVCPPRLCLALFRSVARAGRETSARVRRGSMHGLTIRQQQLISLVAKGLTNKEIASHLNLSEFTIKNHIHRIMKQVEADSRHEVVEAARASGVIGIA